MKTLLTFIALLTFNSCGSSSSGGGSTAPETATSKATPTGVSTSYYVSSSKDLKSCDDTTRGYLAYIEDAKKFQACLAAGWTDVNVNGKDGATGTAGTNGTNGTMVSPNQWYDAITTKMWITTSIMTATTGFTDASSTCTGSYRIPTQSEIILALTHGMTQSAAYIMPSVASIPATGWAVKSSTAVLTTGQSVAAQYCIAQ